MKKSIVNQRNLIVRINRALQNTGGGVVRYNRTGVKPGEGVYVHIDAKHNITNADLPKMAKELGILKAWETTE